MGTSLYRSTQKDLRIQRLHSYGKVAENPTARQHNLWDLSCPSRSLMVLWIIFSISACCSEFICRPSRWSVSKWTFYSTLGLSSGASSVPSTVLFPPLFKFERRERGNNPSYNRNCVRYGESMPLKIMHHA